MDQKRKNDSFHVMCYLLSSNSWKVKAILDVTFNIVLRLTGGRFLLIKKITNHFVVKSLLDRR